MISPSDTTTVFAPLPVRARATLEIFDTAFKLFRRYAGVLLAWSALSGIITLIPGIGIFIYIFTMPLLYGAVSCVMAGAVRGQNVGFKQIWGFTKPRYGALLGVLILAMIMMGVVMFLLMLGVGAMVILFGSAASNYGVFAWVVSWIVGVIGGLIGSSFLLAVVMGWFNLAPVIACLEDAHRGSSALSRAWALLKGNWRKACGVATILALAFSAAATIISVSVGVLFYGGWDKFLGWDASSSLFSGLALSGTLTLFCIVWTPLQAVVGAVFYLDLRTRKEALDLEWTNYAAKPETLSDQNAPAWNQPPAPPAFPSNGPPYAPASSLPAPAQVAQPPVFAPQSSNAPPPPPTFPPSPPQPGLAPAATISINKSPAPASADANEPSSAASADSFAAFAAQVEAAPAPQSEIAPQSPIETAPTIVVPTEVAPTVEVPLNSAPPLPVQPPPVPVQTPPVAPAEAEKTSSFAPPRRFRRERNEEDDSPSSFGGGAR